MRYKTRHDLWIQHRKSAMALVLLLFIVSLCIRLPNINRPISKHYEFNTAIIMINIISWRQAGGGEQFHYTPLMNFQHAGDKLPPNNLYVDKTGNSVYLSFGPAWYLFPYSIYQLFHLPAVPLYLEILNLVFHLITVCLFFYFLEKLIPSGQPGKNSIIVTACCFMIFSPGILWFLGNGYTNVSIMLPFVLGVFIILLPMLEDPSCIRSVRLWLLGILIILLVYIDWYVLFLSFVVSIPVFVKFRKNKRYGRLLFVIGISVVCGIALIFLQFSSHMGPVAVIHYWLSRSSERSFDLAGSTVIKRLSFLIAYFFTSFFPLLLILGISYLKKWRKKIMPSWSDTELLFIRIFAISLLLYNSVLFNWSTEHEYPILPWGILLSFITARVIGGTGNRIVFRVLIGLFLILSITQYYWINRPGPISRDGLAYDSFKKLGESLRQIPPDYTICINLEQNPMVEYYAGRNISRSPDSISAKYLMKELGIKKAVWVSHTGYKMDNIQIIP